MEAIPSKSANSKFTLIQLEIETKKKKVVKWGDQYKNLRDKSDAPSKLYRMNEWMKSITIICWAYLRHTMISVP